jgi:soluble lytic murein transglycosylase-like protein
MRGIGRTISRLSAARAVLAGAAILAGTALRPAHAESSSGPATHPDETAMAIPRIEPPGGASGVGLPQPLAPSEAALVRRIFAMQRRNQIPAAIAETARLSDTSLLGHILADRYIGHPARVAAPELADWLGRYADLPDACAIYSLLLKRLPAGSKPPPAPACQAPASASVPMAAETATGVSDAAREAFVRGHDASAYRLGRAAFTRSHGKDGQAAYVAGLAAWRQGEFATAATLFEAASLADNSGPGLRAGAAFWAARAHLRQDGGAGDQSWRPWLQRAAEAPQTLHGMLARRMLGMRLQASLHNPTLSEADVDAIDATPQGRRAFALLQVGQGSRAEAELRLLWQQQARTSPPLARALFLVAAAAGLNDLAADISGTGDATATGLPIPALHPRGGFWLDPALVYAVAHVESNFDANVVSGAGANGLMQLMPVAASAISRHPDASVVEAMLKDPGQNLRIGQQYLLYLSHKDLAGDDLLHVLASYNSGPSAVQRWDNAATDDPLLFIETIPCFETRLFVQHTLMNLWLYAARFHIPAPSLDALASGVWPRFTPEIRAQGHTLH